MLSIYLKVLHIEVSALHKNVCSLINLKILIQKSALLLTPQDSFLTAMLFCHLPSSAF